MAITDIWSSNNSSDHDSLKNEKEKHYSMLMMPIDGTSCGANWTLLKRIQKSYSLDNTKLHSKRRFLQVALWIVEIDKLAYRCFVHSKTNPNWSQAVSLNKIQSKDWITSSSYGCQDSVKSIETKSPMNSRDRNDRDNQLVQNQFLKLLNPTSLAGSTKLTILFILRNGKLLIAANNPFHSLRNPVKILQMNLQFFQSSWIIGYIEKGCLILMYMELW